MVWFLTGIAFMSAVISGVAGVGGGTILIAALYAVGLAPAVAVPLHAAVQLAANFSRTLAYLPHVDWRAAGWFFLTCLPLPFVIAPAVAAADVNVIRLVLAVFVALALLPAPRRAVEASTRVRMLLAGALNGTVGMVLGATGLVIAPFFLQRRWSQETTVGTLALCQTLGHGIKIVAFAAYGFALLDSLPVLVPLALAVVAGTLVGRMLMYRVSRRLFEVLFRVILGTLALRLAWTGIEGLV